MTQVITLVRMSELFLAHVHHGTDAGALVLVAAPAGRGRQPDQVAGSWDCPALPPGEFARPSVSTSVAVPPCRLRSRAFWRQVAQMGSNSHAPPPTAVTTPIVAGRPHTDALDAPPR